jgi:carbohydrate-selective porin OprB
MKTELPEPPSAAETLEDHAGNYRTCFLSGSRNAFRQHRLRNKIAKGLALVGLVGTFAASSAKAGDSFSDWWEGKYATGNWFGARNSLADHGVTITGEWKANFLWNVDGGLQQRFGYDDEFKFRPH